MSVDWVILIYPVNKNVDTTPWYKNDDHSGQFGNQRTVNVAGAREKVGSLVVQQSGIQCFNCKEFGHFAKECRKTKRVKDSAYHKKKMFLCKQAEQGVPLQEEQYDWLADTDEEVDEHELEVHYSYMDKIQEVPTADSGTDSEPVEQDAIHNDQNDVKSDDERFALANLIAILKLDVDENKKIQKQLKKANTILAQELKECKAILAETRKQTEFDKYKAFNDRTVDYDKLKRKLNETLGQLALKDIEIKEGLKTKAYKMSVVKQKHDELMKLSLLTKSHYEGLVKQKTKVITDLKLREEHDIDKMLSIEKQVKFLNETVYKRSQSIQTIHMMAPKFGMKDSNAFRKEREQYIEIQYLKAQLQDKNIAISELKKLIEKGKGKYVDTKFDRPSVVRQLNAQRIPKPSVLGKLAPFSNSLKRIYFPKTRSVPKANVSKGLSKPVTTQTLPQTARQAISNTNVLKPRMYRINNRTSHTRAPQLPQTVKNTNLRMSTSTGVNHKPNVSRPQHKSNQLRDKVLPNNSQVKVKKTQVEFHPRISSVSNKIKSVTACKDSLNSRTLNANAICATCKKCLVDSNHFACVTKMLNGVHARTKKSNVVPISTRKHKAHAKKSIATPHKTKIIQLILLIVDSGCTKHMMGNLKLLYNFVEKFLGTVCFGNDQFAAILGYGDLDLEVAFRKSTCFVRDLQGKDLLIDNRGFYLYTISLQESTSSTPLCLMDKASPTQAWLCIEGCLILTSTTSTCFQRRIS
nr:hypothetical protein [Tanacetum cinerariifolium]